MQKRFEHTPVLLHEAVNSLNIKKNGVYIDATFGSGGHSKLILSQLGINGKLLAIDCDPQSVASAKIKDPRFSIIYGRFSSVVDYVTERKLIDKVDGVLLDLGVSARQLEDPERGFSFMNDGLLDMRMDPTHGHSAAEWLLTAKEKDIIFVLRNYGEERFAKRIARAITAYNRNHSIMRTKELANIIASAMPLKEKYKHPATRSFQAIRICINNELKEIDLVLKGSLSVLALGGRISVISFHSLEDRLVKRFIRNHVRGPQLPSRIPITESQLRVLGGRKLKTIGKIFPSIVEVNKNPRARSAILRIAERII